MTRLITRRRSLRFKHLAALLASAALSASSSQLLVAAEPTATPTTTSTTAATPDPITVTSSPATNESDLMHDFSDRVANRRIDITNLSNLELAPDGLRFTLPAKQSGGLVIRPARKRWNIADFSRAVLDLSNTSTDARVRVRVRLDNDKATDWSDSALNDGFVRPSERRQFNVFCFRDWPDWKQYPALSRFPGMNGVPGGMMWHWHYLDAADVRLIHIDFETEDRPVDLVLHRITAAGPITPPEISDPKFFPFVDEFGQFAHASWPGKIADDRALVAAHTGEERDLAAHPRRGEWDRFGGWNAGPQLKATGQFRTEKVDGRWWLVDPDGRLFWSHGVCCVGPESGETAVRSREQFFTKLPPTAGLTAPAWRFDDNSQPTTVNFITTNLIRLFGAEWKTKSDDLAIRRLESWGMNTVGNWSNGDIEKLHRLPYTHAVHLWPPRITDSLFDVFDPAWQTTAKKVIDDETRGLKDDPWCIGFFVDNEIGWTGSPHDFIAKLFAVRGDSFSKREFIADLQKVMTVEQLNTAMNTRFANWDAVLANKNKIVKEQVDPLGAVTVDFYKRYCDRYFDTVGPAVRAAAPNKLYLGCRMNVFNDLVITSAARYCDVLSFNLYRSEVSAFQLPAGVDKPVLVSEFHFGALDRGMLHPGLQSASDQRDRADKYRAYVMGALRNPLIVGTHWFAYAPEPLTARGDGENYQDGLIDVCDVPYPETRDALRDCGAMYELRTK